MKALIRKIFQWFLGGEKQAPPVKMSTGLKNSVTRGVFPWALLQNGILVIYSGPPPDDADATETGVKLVEITDSGQPHIAGFVSINGLKLGCVPENRVIKEASQTWKGRVVDSGRAGYFRFYSNRHETGASKTAKRLQGTVGVARGNLRLSTVDFIPDTWITLDSFAVEFPSAGENKNE